MICKKCNKEIRDDSNFCVYCGTKVEKEIVETNEKKKRIPDKVSNLIFNIISAIIGAFGIIFCFINVTNGSSNTYGYKGESNVISYFNVNFGILNNHYEPNTPIYDGHYISSIIGYIFLLVSLLLCFVILLFSITNLITNSKSKWLNVLHCINFSIVIILLSLLQIDGGFSGILAALYFLYYLLKLVFKLIDGEEKTSIKVVYGIGVGFFGLSLMNIMSSGLYTVDNFVNLYVNNYAYINKFYASMNIVSFVLFVLVVALAIASYVMLLKNKKFIASILIVVLTLLMLLASISSNLANISGELVSGLIAPTVLCLITSTFIFSVGLIEKRK